jgi:hypothetical protein
MAGRILQSLALVAAVLPSVFAQDQPKCGGGQLCPEDSPCCSRTYRQEEEQD